MFESGILLKNVDSIYKPGFGKVYRGVIPILELYKGLIKGDIRYAPKYQRGFKLTQEDLDEKEYNQVCLLTDTRLQIDDKRAMEMAVKYLSGNLFNTEIIWNARSDNDYDNPVYNKEEKTLQIDSFLTIPDSGHRHKAYYFISEWYRNNESIPEKILVDGQPVSKNDIIKDLKSLDIQEAEIFVTIFNLTPKDEGRLYNEFNTEGKKPATAVALDVNPEKTAASRFVYQLMEECDIFKRDEIECHRNTIGTKSRKLTTNATLVSATDLKTKKLLELEKDTNLYDELVNFFCNFFTEWAHFYPAWLPKANADDRNELRSSSFALSNIIIYPLFGIAFELWETYHACSLDWTKHDGWKNTVAALASKVDLGNGKKVNVMDRENPAWKGKILIEGKDKNGNVTWTLSSTRNTRKSSFQYLCDIVKFEEAKEKIKKSGKKK